MRIATFILAAAVLGLAPALADAENTANAATTSNNSSTNATPAPAANSDSSDSDTLVPAPTDVLKDMDTKNISPGARAAIEDIIKNYLTKTNPEVLIDASKELARREQGAAQVKSDEMVAGNKDRIYNDPNSPTAGNPKGDVTVVEFFDYNCGYCKLSEDGVEQLLKNDKGVKFIYKDFPVLGDESVVAAHASFAAAKQGKFLAFHDTLMNKREHLSDDLIFQAAKTAGLDVDKLKKDMTSPAIDKMIQDNIKLGMDIGVRGTPMFIINGQVFPGSMQYELLKKNVDDMRAAAAKKQH